MKLEKPILYKNLFSVHDDERGFLTALDVQLFLKKFAKSIF